MIIKSNSGRRGNAPAPQVSFPVKVEEPKVEKVSKKEEKKQIKNPDDGEGEG